MLKQQFQRDIYDVVAVAYETGVHGVHPHWQMYIQTAKAVQNMKTLLSSALEGSGEEQNLHIERAIGTPRSCLNYVYAVKKQHELGWVQYAKGHNIPKGYSSRGCDNLLWLHYNMKPW